MTALPVLTLDADQRAVADLPVDASGVVVGAAGSGKTAALVARVAALVGPVCTPDELVVLTPTRQTATVLRDQLSLAVGVATPGALARSLAAFAFSIVRAHAVATGQDSPQLLTGSDEDHLIADLLAGDALDEGAGTSRWPEWMPVGVRDTPGFRAEVRAFLAECTTLGISPNALAQRAADEANPSWTALASFAAEYHDVRSSLRGAHRDTAGLIREAVGLVRTLPDGAAGIERLRGLRAILVDDAQELTLGGVELLEACRARGIAVLAFGDPDVGSGSFRGATPENFARLAAHTSVYALTGEHRGTPAQRDLFAEVTSRIGAVGVVAHRRRPHGAAPDGSVRAHTARSVAEEHDIIARTLRERHIHEGVQWGHCAVIAHDVRQVAALEAELAAREVPTRAGTHGAPLADARAVRQLLQLVLLADRDASDWSGDEFATALSAAGLDAIEHRRLRTALRHAAMRARATDEPVGDTMASAFAHPVEFDLVDTREARRAARVARAIHTIRHELRRGATAHELLWQAWEGLGYERAWAAAAAGSGPVAAQAGRDLDAVVSLFQAAKRHGERDDGTAPLAFVRGVLDADVADDRLEGPALGGAVQVLTPAGALGLEFDTVVIAGLQEGIWPNLRLRGTLLETWRLAGEVGTIDRRRGVLHDELRLFARAVSRARRLVVVTAVDDDDIGPSPLFDLLPPVVPWVAEHPLSLRGLVAQHRRTLTSDRASAAARLHAAGQLALLDDAGMPGAAVDQWYGVRPVTATGPLRDRTREHVSVSPSRLERLEECALDWVIADLGGEARSAVAGLGTIIHFALETATSSDEAALWEIVESRWGELEFESPWRERAERETARQLVHRLAEYLRAFERAGGRLLSAEPRFTVPIGVDGGVDAMLNGVMDRVEVDADGRVMIVDLKTGKRDPHTAVKVRENAQLSAYQLALESGAIPAAEGLTPAGAKLLVLRPGTKRATYAEPVQPPLDDESRAAFIERVRAAVVTMSGETFVAPFEQHCRDEHSYGVCRIHTIGAVSAS